MKQTIIYDKSGNEKCAIKSLEYNGTYMGERYVSCDISSPCPIKWAVGDYLVFRSERFTMYNLPSATKSARVNTYGKAFEYKSIRFSSAEEELRVCQFLDVVPKDNNMHYTLLPNFSFYCEKPSDLAERISANLDRMYPNEWEIKVADNTRLTEGVSLSFSSNTCWEALAQSNTNVNIDLDFIVNCYIDDDGVFHKTVTIGGTGEEILQALMYGKGNGLLSIDRQKDESQAIVTRLYAYGNSRNIPYRYYNRQYPDDANTMSAINSVYAPNLMLPDFLHYWKNAKDYIDENGNLKKAVYTSLGYQALSEDGGSKVYYVNEAGDKVYITWADVTYEFWQHFTKEDGADGYYCDRVWIDSINGKASCGILEGNKFFDGSDEKVEDVYPSIENFTSTTTLVNALGTDAASELHLCTSNGTIYEQGTLNTIKEYIPSETIKESDGIIPEKETATPTFEVLIKNLGFNINDTELKADDTPSLSMKTGPCAGRDFNILSCTKMVRNSVAGDWEAWTEKDQGIMDWCYKLKCEAVADESIGMYFPNKTFPIKQDEKTTAYASEGGDEFVLLGINMPDVYVEVAEKKLVQQAILYLAENDHTVFNFTPKIDNIYMARNPEIANKMREGNYITIKNSDSGFEIDEKLPISQLKIKCEKEIPEYEITMSDQQEASLAQRVSAEVKQTFSGFFSGTGSSTGSANAYTDAFLKRGGDSTTGTYTFGYVNTGGVISPQYEIGKGFSLSEDKMVIRNLGGGYMKFNCAHENIYVQDGGISITETLESDGAFTIQDCKGTIEVYFKAYYKKHGGNITIKSEKCYYGIKGKSGVSKWEEIDLRIGDEWRIRFYECDGKEQTYSLRYVVEYSYRTPGEVDGGVSFYIEGTNVDTTRYSGKSPKRATIATNSISLFDTSVGASLNNYGEIYKGDESDSFLLFGGAHYLGTDTIELGESTYMLNSADKPALADAIQTLTNGAKPVEFVFRAEGLDGAITARSLSVQINDGKLLAYICVQGEIYELESQFSVGNLSGALLFNIKKL